MAASSNDKISKISTGDLPAVATVTAPRSSGVTALSVDTQLNWATDTGIKFSTFQLDSNNNKIADSQTDWRGVSNGTNAISNIIRTGGAADTGNLVGDKVVMIITAQWGEDIAEAMLTSHSQTGALLPAAVQTAIGTNGIVSSNIASAAITGVKMDGTYKISRQNDTTNITEATARILTGWGVITTGAVNVSSEVVTFNTPFTLPPVVTLTYGGDAPSSTVYGNGAVNIKSANFTTAHTISATGFTARFQTSDGTNYTAGNSVFYQWMAVGL